MERTATLKRRAVNDRTGTALAVARPASALLMRSCGVVVALW